MATVRFPGNTYEVSPTGEVSEAGQPVGLLQRGLFTGAKDTPYEGVYGTVLGGRNATVGFVNQQGQWNFGRVQGELPPGLLSAVRSPAPAPSTSPSPRQPPPALSLVTTYAFEGGDTFSVDTTGAVWQLVDNKPTPTPWKVVPVSSVTKRVIDTNTNDIIGTLVINEDAKAFSYIPSTGGAIRTGSIIPITSSRAPAASNLEKWLNEEVARFEGGKNTLNVLREMFSKYKLPRFASEADASVIQSLQSKLVPGGKDVGHWSSPLTGAEYLALRQIMQDTGIQTGGFSVSWWPDEWPYAIPKGS